MFYVVLCTTFFFSLCLQLEEAVFFEDYTDAELKRILLSMAGTSQLAVSPQTAAAVVAEIAQQRRMANFGNAGTVSNFLSRAKLNRANRLAKGSPSLMPGELIAADFLVGSGAESGTDIAPDFSGLYNLDHLTAFAEELETTVLAAREAGRDPAELLARSHLVITGPPGLYL